MKILKAFISDTGNGPCIEIKFENGEYIWISDHEGCGLPTKESWAVGRYDINHECIDGWFEDNSEPCKEEYRGNDYGDDE